MAAPSNDLFCAFTAFMTSQQLSTITSGIKLPFQLGFQLKYVLLTRVLRFMRNYVGSLSSAFRLVFIKTRRCRSSVDFTSKNLNRRLQRVFRDDDCEAFKAPSEVLGTLVQPEIQFSILFMKSCTIGWAFDVETPLRRWIKAFRNFNISSSAALEWFPRHHPTPLPTCHAFKSSPAFIGLIFHVFFSVSFIPNRFH